MYSHKKKKRENKSYHYFLRKVNTSQLRNIYYITVISYLSQHPDPPYLSRNI